MKYNKVGIIKEKIEVYGMKRWIWMKVKDGEWERLWLNGLVRIFGNGEDLE